MYKNMQNSRKNQSLQPQQVSVLLFDAFSNHCLANLVEPMRAVNALTGSEAYSWQFVSLDEKSVTSSSGLPVIAHCSLSDVGGGDFLFVMPSYNHRKMTTPACLSALRSAGRRFKTIAGLDTGSWLMAAAGLLTGRQATIHWDAIDTFAEAFPDVDVVRKKYVLSGNRITCGGAMTAFDLISRLIGDRFGEVMRLEVAAFFLIEGSEPETAPLKNLPRSRFVSSAVALMQTNLEEPLSIPDIAQKIGCAPRDLESRFNKELATTPRTVYRRLRLSAARRFVETSNYPIAEIALRCGYKDASAMTRAFRAEFGRTPREVRG